MSGLGIMDVSVKNSVATLEYAGYFLNYYSDNGICLCRFGGGRLTINSACKMSACAIEDIGKRGIQLVDRFGSSLLQLMSCVDLSRFNDFLIAYLSEYMKFLPNKSRPDTPTNLFSPLKDLGLLKDAWLGKGTVDDVELIIQDNGNNRQDIYSALLSDYAVQIQEPAVGLFLQQLAVLGHELCVTLVNEGVKQVFVSKILQVERDGDWLKCQGSEIKFSLNTVNVGSVWMIHKPTVNGWVNYIDVFDRGGRHVLKLNDNGDAECGDSHDWSDLLTEAVADHIVETV